MLLHHACLVRGNTIQSAQTSLLPFYSVLFHLNTEVHREGIGSCLESPSHDMNSRIRNLLLFICCAHSNVQLQFCLAMDCPCFSSCACHDVSLSRFESHFLGNGQLVKSSQAASQLKTSQLIDTILSKSSVSTIRAENS